MKDWLFLGCASLFIVFTGLQLWLIVFDPSVKPSVHAAIEAVPGLSIQGPQSVWVSMATSSSVDEFWGQMGLKSVYAEGKYMGTELTGPMGNYFVAAEWWASTEFPADGTFHTGVSLLKNAGDTTWFDEPHMGDFFECQNGMCTVVSQHTKD